MSVLFTDAEVAEDRAEAEARMLDTFEIRTYQDDQVYVYDEDLDEDVENYFEVLLTTPGYIPPTRGVQLSQNAEVGGRTAVSAQREIRTPWNTPAVPPNAVAICTAIGSLTPPRMLDKRYRVGGSDGASQGTACHLEIVEELS